MILAFFIAVAVAHLAALSMPLFFDLFVLPGYMALFILISLVSAVASTRLRLRPWHIVAFLPILIAADQGYLFFLTQLNESGTWLRNITIVDPDEYIHTMAGTGVIVSILSWILTGIVLIVSLVVKRRHGTLAVYRLVDTRDEWERVHAFMQMHMPDPGISAFHWSLLSKRCFCFIAESENQIRSSILLAPGNPGTAFLSDFTMDHSDTGIELLGSVLNRPELRTCTDLFLVERRDSAHSDPAQEDRAAFLFRQLLPDERILPLPASLPEFLRDFSPDGSHLRPFAQARILVSARGEGQ